MSFITRDGHLVSTAEAYEWLTESQTLAEQGDDESALKQASKALSWFQTAGAKSADETGLMDCYMGEGASLSQIAGIWAARENWKEAARYYQQARTAFITAQEYEEESITAVNAAENANIICLNLALVKGHLKQYQESLQLADEALTYSQETEDLSSQITALRLLGAAHASLGHKQIAAEKFRSALRLAREIGDPSLEKQINKELDW